EPAEAATSTAMVMMIVTWPVVDQHELLAAQTARAAKQAPVRIELGDDLDAARSRHDADARAVFAPLLAELAASSAEALRLVMTDDCALAFAHDDTLVRLFDDGPFAAIL